MIKTPAVQITQRQMRQIQVPHVPRRAFLLVPTDCLAKKRELEPEPAPVRRFHVPGVVPPLCLKVRMIEMVPRKLILVARQRRAVLRGRRRNRQQHDGYPYEPTLHAQPRSDSAPPQRSPDTI